LLYGPILSALFTKDLSVSLSALTGKQSKYWTDDEANITLGGVYNITSGTYYMDVRRNDIDFAISFRIAEKIKIIAGYKYQQIDMTFRETVVLDGPNTYNTRHHITIIEIPSHGPAFGFGYAHTFGNALFVSVNLTGLYMWSKFDIKENEVTFYRPDGTSYLKNTDLPETKSYDTRQVGFNLEPSLGIVVQNNLIFVLGLRYQMLKTEFVDDFVVAHVDLTPDGWITDTIYGAFVSIMYKF